MFERIANKLRRVMNTRAVVICNTPDRVIEQSVYDLRVLQKQMGSKVLRLTVKACSQGDILLLCQLDRFAGK